MLVEPFDIPGNGRMCIAQDPLGAAFGVWQATATIGAQVYAEPGSLIWTDGRVPDPEAGRTFYASVFGYRYEPIDGEPPDYTTIHFDTARDGEPVGGIGGMMGAPEGTPAHWLAYFLVPTPMRQRPVPARPAAAFWLSRSTRRTDGWRGSPTRTEQPSSSWARRHQRDHELWVGPGGVAAQARPTADEVRSWPAPGRNRRRGPQTPRRRSSPGPGRR